MNVLSLCDGMSCLQIAFKVLTFKIDKYYSSEIDKFANQQTKLNFPDTIQLGDIKSIDVSKLDKIDFVAGGTPCTNFSFAGKRKGMSTIDNVEIHTLDKYLDLKKQGFQFEGESYLFWEYMRILTDIRKYNPDVKFLLENVEMGSKWERILSEAIGIYGVHINSALVSAQNRRRIYWTNIRTKKTGLFGELHSDIPQPKDRGILLKDVLQDCVPEKYYLKNCNPEFNGMDVNGKNNSLRIGGSCSQTKKHNYDPIRNPITKKDKLVIQLNKSKESGGLQPYQQNRIYDIKGLMPALSAQLGGRNNVEEMGEIRRITPLECARLQTIPEWYKWNCSDTQAYKMLGNGWTIDVIVHILKYLK